VLFDYNPEDFEVGVDIRLAVGEIVTLTSVVDDQWYKGRKANGEEGIFPKNFVEEAVSCTVTFNYDAKDHDELTLKVGDVIVIAEEIEGWYKGSNDRGQSGMFPSTYVQKN